MRTRSLCADAGPAGLRSESLHVRVGVDGRLWRTCLPSRIPRRAGYLVRRPRCRVGPDLGLVLASRSPGANFRLSQLRGYPSLPGSAGPVPQREQRAWLGMGKRIPLIYILAATVCALSTAHTGTYARIPGME